MPRQYDWDVYFRRQGSRFSEVYAAFSARGIVTRQLEQMFYGLAEFEITDPDSCQFGSIRGLLLQRLMGNL